MFAVNIALGRSVWRLLYKDEEKAKKVFASLHSPEATSPNTIWVSAEDDFGQIFYGSAPAIHGVMFEDLDKAKMANVELFLHQQRVQAMATKAAQSDPGLRASQRMNGPAMLQPMGGFPRN